MLQLIKDKGGRIVLVDQIGERMLGKLLDGGISVCRPGKESSDIAALLVAASDIQLRLTNAAAGRPSLKHQAKGGCGGGCGCHGHNETGAACHGDDHGHEADAKGGCGGCGCKSRTEAKLKPLGDPLNQQGKLSYAASGLCDKAVYRNRYKSAGRKPALFCPKPWVSKVLRYQSSSGTGSAVRH